MATVRVAAWDEGALPGAAGGARRAALAPSGRYAAMVDAAGSGGGSAGGGAPPAETGGVVAVQLPAMGALQRQLRAVEPGMPGTSTAWLLESEDADFATGRDKSPLEVLVVATEGGLRALSFPPDAGRRGGREEHPCLPAAGGGGGQQHVRPTCRGAVRLPLAGADGQAAAVTFPSGSATLAALASLPDSTHVEVRSVAACRGGTAVVVRVRCTLQPLSSPARASDYAASSSEIQSDSDGDSTDAAHPGDGDKLTDCEGAAFLLLQDGELLPAGFVALGGIDEDPWTACEVSGTALLLLHRSGELHAWANALRAGAGAESSARCAIGVPPVVIANPTASMADHWRALAVLASEDGCVAIVSAGTVTTSVPIDDIMTIDTCDASIDDTGAGSLTGSSPEQLFWCDRSTCSEWQGGPGRTEAMMRRADAALAIAARAEGGSTWAPTTSFAAGGERRRRRAMREKQSRAASAGRRRVLLPLVAHSQEVDTLLFPGERDTVAIVTVSKASGRALSITFRPLCDRDERESGGTDVRDVETDIASLDGTVCSLGSCVYLLTATGLVAVLPSTDSGASQSQRGLRALLERGGATAAVAVRSLNSWSAELVAECLLDRALNEVMAIEAQDVLDVSAGFSTTAREQLPAVLADVSRALDNAVDAKWVVPALRKVLRVAASSPSSMRDKLLRLGAQTIPRALRIFSESSDGSASELCHYLVLIRRLQHENANDGDTNEIGIAAMATPLPHNTRSGGEAAPHTAPPAMPSSTAMRQLSGTRKLRRSLFRAESTGDSPPAHAISATQRQEGRRAAPSAGEREDHEALVTRWQRGRMNAIEIVQEALLTNRLSTAMAYLVEKGQRLGPERVIELARALAYRLIWQAEGDKAVSALWRAGDQPIKALKWLREATVYRRLRRLLQDLLGRIHDGAESTRTDDELWQAMERLEALYPNESYARASEGLPTSSLDFFACGDIGFESTGSGSYEPWQLDDVAHSVDGLPTHASSSSGPYMCLPAAWVREWDAETLARVEIEGRALGLLSHGAGPDAHRRAWSPPSRPMLPHEWTGGMQILVERPMPAELEAWVSAVPQSSLVRQSVHTPEGTIQMLALPSGVWEKMAARALPSQRAVLEQALLREGVISDEMLDAQDVPLHTLARAGLVSADDVPSTACHLGSAKLAAQVASLRLAHTLGACVRWNGPAQVFGVLSHDNWAAWQVLARWDGRALDAAVENVRWLDNEDSDVPNDALLEGLAKREGGPLAVLCILSQSTVALEECLSSQHRAIARDAYVPHVHLNSLASLADTHPVLWHVLAACANPLPEMSPRELEYQAVDNATPRDVAINVGELQVLDHYIAWRRRQFLCSGGDASLVDLVRHDVPESIRSMLERATSCPREAGAIAAAGNGFEHSALALIHEWEDTCWSEIDRIALPDSTPPDSPISELEDLLVEGRALAALEVALSKDQHGAAMDLLVAASRAAATRAFSEDCAVAAAVIATLLAGDNEAAASIRCDVAALRRVAMIDAPRSAFIAAALRDSFAQTVASPQTRPSISAAATDLVKALLECELSHEGRSAASVSRMALPAAVIKRHGLDGRIVESHLQRLAAGDDWLSVLSEAEVLRVPRQAVLDVISAAPGKGVNRANKDDSHAWWRHHATRALGRDKLSWEAFERRPKYELLALAARVENGSMGTTELVPLCRSLGWPALAVTAAALGVDPGSAAAAWMEATTGTQGNAVLLQCRNFVMRRWRAWPAGDENASTQMGDPVEAKADLAATTSALCALRLHTPVARAFEIFKPCPVLALAAASVRCASIRHSEAVVDALERLHAELCKLAGDGVSAEDTSSLESKFDAVARQAKCRTACIGVLCIFDTYLARTRSVWENRGFIDALQASRLCDASSAPRTFARAIESTVVRYNATCTLAAAGGGVGDATASGTLPLAEVLEGRSNFDEGLLKRLTSAGEWDRAFEWAGVLDGVEGACVIAIEADGDAELLDGWMPLPCDREGVDDRARDSHGRSLSLSDTTGKQRRSKAIARVCGPRGKDVAIAAASELVEDWRTWLGDTADAEDVTMWQEINELFTSRGVDSGTAGRFALAEADALRERGASPAAERAAASAAYDWLASGPQDVLSDRAVELLQRRVWLLGAKGATVPTPEADNQSLVLLAIWRLLEEGQVGAAARLAQECDYLPRELALCEAAAAAAASPLPPVTSLPSLGEEAVSHLPPEALTVGTDALAAVRAISEAIEPGRGRSFVERVGAALAAARVLERTYPEAMAAEPQALLEDLLRWAAAFETVIPREGEISEEWALCRRYVNAHASSGAGARPADALASLLLEGSLGGAAPRGAPCRRLTRLVRSSAALARSVATCAGTHADEVAHALVRRTLERRQQLSAPVEATALSVAARLYESAGARGLEGADVLVSIASAQALDWCQQALSQHLNDGPDLHRKRDSDDCAPAMVALARIASVVVRDARAHTAGIVDAVVRGRAVRETISEFLALAADLDAFEGGSNVARACASPRDGEMNTMGSLGGRGSADFGADLAVGTGPNAAPKLSTSVGRSFIAALLAAAERVGGDAGREAAATLKDTCGLARLEGEALREAALDMIASVAGVGGTPSEEFNGASTPLGHAASGGAPGAGSRGAAAVATPSPIAALKARFGLFDSPRPATSPSTDKARGKALLASAHTSLAVASRRLATAGCAREAGRCEALAAAVEMAIDMVQAPMRLTPNVAAQWLSSVLAAEQVAFRMACIAGGRVPAVAAAAIEACADAAASPGGRAGPTATRGAWSLGGKDAAALGMSLPTHAALQVLEWAYRDSIGSTTAAGGGSGSKTSKDRDRDGSLSVAAALSGLQSVLGEGLACAGPLLHRLVSAGRTDGGGAGAAGDMEAQLVEVLGAVCDRSLALTLAEASGMDSSAREFRVRMDEWKALPC